MGSNDKKGFTLLEMLIALALLGMMMALVAGSYYASARAKRNVEDRIELAVMGRAALDSMIKEIAGAYIVSDNSEIPPFEGENGGSFDHPQDKLSFYTMTYDPRSLGGGGNMAEIEYKLEKNPDMEGFYFLMKRADPFPDKEPKEGGISYDLAEQVTGLAFEYQDDNDIWSGRWDSDVSKELPKLVHIKIILKGKDSGTIALDGYAAPMRWQ